MTGRPRHNQHLTRVGQNWGPLDRQARAAAARRKKARPAKVLVLLILAGLILLLCAGMVA